MPKILKNIFKLIRRRIKAAFILLLILISAFGFIITRKRQISYKTTTVQRSTVSETVSASGKVIAKKQAVLHFISPGKLTWVGISQGDYVKAGQAIASLDKRELEKNLIKALRDYSKERNDFEEDRLVSYKDRVFTDTIKRILEKNQWDLDKAVLDVEIKDLALQYATLITPIAGIVTRIDTPVAGVNIAATDLFVVSDPSSIVFEAEVDETDIGRVQQGKAVEVTLDSYPDDVFTGTVSRIDFTATTTSSGGTAFLVDIALPDNSNLRFKPGMNGDAEIILKQKENALTVPTEAIFQEDDKNYVYVLEANKPVKKEVQTGVESISRTEITNGLVENEVIIENALSIK